MPLDGQRAGVESLCQQSRTQADDLLDNFGLQRSRRAVRTPRAWRQARLTLGAVAPEELVQPAAVHPVHTRELGDRTTLAQMRLDQIPPDVHPETPSTSCLRCLDTSIAKMSPMS